MRQPQSSTFRLALIASLVAWDALSPRLARAETATPPTETPASSDTSAAGKSAPPAPFGTKGTRALGLVVDVGAADSNLPSRPLGLGVRTTIDSFVLDHVSVGGSFGFEYADTYGSFYNVGGGPRLGYALPLGDKLVLWPMVTLRYDAGTVPVPPATGTWSLQDVRVGGELFPAAEVSLDAGASVGGGTVSARARRGERTPHATSDAIRARRSVDDWGCLMVVLRTGGHEQLPCRPRRATRGWPGGATFEPRVRQGRGHR